MHTSTAISHRLSSATTSLWLNSLKPTSNFEFPSQKLAFAGGFIPNRVVLGRNRIWGPYAMVELTRCSAVRSSNGDEDTIMLEPETPIDGSFQQELVAAGGLESTLNKLSKWIVSALFGGLVILRHDPEALWAIIGSIVNAVLSLTLKRILNQERPITTPRSDPGMPSSHAQSIFFTFVFADLSIVEWVGANEFSLAVSVLVLALGSYLSWLRVSQRLHTMSQVVVGAVLGSIFSALWYWFWRSTVMDAFASCLWIQLLVILVACGFCFIFIIYVVRNWFKDVRLNI